MMLMSVCSGSAGDEYWFGGSHCCRAWPTLLKKSTRYQIRATAEQWFEQMREAERVEVAR